MKISFDETAVTDRIDEKSSMVWPQYVLLATSLMLCFWVPEPLYQTIVLAVNSIGGGL
jgi:hydrogenase-4 component F